ncbi:ABC transporter substrate-binding protein [Celeribacter indicus]|uniref:Thiamine pyrimidine synthase n=1 Tax=Celeribacter indicus TaxID=1208324 RepID=A0A0B5E8Z6_9RHOB|nr:ABC transporter substrate-binding protein [Celeribacter indicus]AJE48792.1 sulfonate/nitrate transporter [Celeribacter indicus]SDX59624.1 NitT/TauT family transport system substrate-binding protein [Celeribacter indicus]
MKFLAAAGLATILLSPAASQAEDVTVQIDWLPAGDKAFVYAALYQGYFEEEGLDVTIVSGRGSSDALTKLATGSADFATGDISALFSAAAEQDIPVKAIYSIFTKQPSATVVLAESGIESIADLKGKTNAFAALSGSQAVFDHVLAKNGISRDDIELRQAEPAVLAPLLSSGQVDAIGAWVTTAPLALALLQENGKEGRVLPWADFGLEGYGLSLYTSDRMIAENPEVVSSFVRAFGKGVEFSIQHPEETIDALIASAPEIDREIALAQLEAAIPLMSNEISDADGMGALRSERLKAGWEVVAASQGYDREVIDPDELVDPSFR